MVEEAGDSHILDDAAVADSSTEALSVALRPSEAPSLGRQAKRSESDLLARMSHEMRTPLSVILGFAQLLESGSPFPTAPQKRSIDRILEAGWCLEKLINMTRDLALIESGMLSVSSEPVPLATVMLDVEAMIEPQAQMRGVRVTFPLFESPCTVSADRIRLQEVLGSLLSAAIEHSERQRTVVVNCDTHGSDWIRLGIGHDGKELDGRTQSFQPFESLEQQAAAADGTGIGLLLARRLVGLMGGAIVAESVDGARNLFSFDLKRAPVPTAAGRSDPLSFRAGCLPQERPTAKHGSFAR